ncbi:alpha/beta-hydrolase [Calocera cornea HHB12733]|uniref:Alpha/beta-hydrolase n=1 Tax=Calocera cornea HHB12733 TaxID=1353952 RepID=A0A165I2Y7_9BASI|nr:alpha/beta-hydrolase [Calocera cornea HHB12733]
MYSLLLQLAYGLSSFFAPPSADDGLLVQTAQGPVRGISVNGNRQFLGIPYAADTATYRFEPPQQAYPRGSQVFDASNWGDSCPAEISPSAAAALNISGILDQQLKVPTSENCLNLNIWAPATNRPQKTAVMIWVYGGSGKFGTSNTLPYNGSFFTRDYDDITIVSINYRTNVFGFPNAPGSWNVGLLDVEFAVKWVYANIANFGGDPNRITLFGESFGSLAVDAYAIRNPQDTIVKRVILESGVVGLDFFIAPDPTVWTNLTKATGCTSRPDVMKCMRSVPWKDLQATILSSNVTFTAITDGQCYTLFGDWQRRLTQGGFLRVPTLLGNNANEGDIFVAAYEATGGKLPKDVSFNVASAAITDVLFHCLAFQSASLRVGANSPTYRYIYEGVFDDINNGNKSLRAFHTSEIPIVFQTYTLSPFSKNYKPTDVEIKLSKYIQNAWVLFAREGPQGLESLKWRPFVVNDIAHPSINVLGGANNPTGVDYERTATHDAGCSKLEKEIDIIWPIIHHLNGNVL